MNVSVWQLKWIILVVQSQTLYRQLLNMTNSKDKDIGRETGQKDVETAWDQDNLHGFNIKQWSPEQSSGPVSESLPMFEYILFCFMLGYLWRWKH